MGVLTIRPGLRGCWNSTIVMRASRICTMNCPDAVPILQRYWRCQYQSSKQTILQMDRDPHIVPSEFLFVATGSSTGAVRPDAEAWGDP